MPKRKFARIAALVTTAVATVALIGGAVAVTGAYYTDSHAGQIGGTNGTVALNVAGGVGPGGLEFDFTGLLPGQTKTAPISIGNPTGNSEDVWLVFDNSNGMWSVVNDLGQYGKFTVGGYIYDNLNNKNTNTLGPTPGQAGTPTGDFMSGSCSTVPRVPINYLPRAIKITILAGGGSATFPITFTYNPCMIDHQGDPIFNPGTADPPIPSLTTGGALKFNVVAFQGGVDPTSPFNGANALTPLNLAPFNPFTLQYNQP